MPRTDTLLLALDQGTTSSRAILFDRSAAIVSVAQREFRQHFPQPGWVEHDATEIWATQRATISEVLASAGVGIECVHAIGITNQRETTLVWDRSSGEPIAPAIVWQDRRTAPRCAQLKAEGREAFVRERTGLVLDPYFSGTKIGWLLDHVPGARARAERGELAFGTIDTWLAWKLSGGALHVTDPSNASRTLLFDLHTADWSDTLLALFGVPRAMLPRIVPSSGPIGEVELEGRRVPLAGIAGDQQSALFGQACFEPGMAKNTYGTGCFLLMNTGDRPQASASGLLTTAAWTIEGGPDAGRRYALEGSVFVAGAIVQWLRDGLGIIARAADVEPLARSVPDAAGVHCVPAFTGLGAPWWDPDARGALLGLTRGATRAHVARAALESIAFQSADLLVAMQRDAAEPLTELRVDGGASANDLLMQFQADLLGVPVVRPRVLETTALGAACLAGLATGYWDDAVTLARHWQVDRRFVPAMSRDEAAVRMADWHDAVARVRSGAA
ncbi:MAG: glycerol kinase GlpK [Burkholderiales bacterium]|jgi:glycerol kinase|nr:glycerol kinase GlpK [Burkholderiales bacterium]MCZ8101421.1 glycerol kinase GlpK [Burkholderiales bacterium]